MVTEYFCLQLRQMLQVALPLHSTMEVLQLTPDQICGIPGVDPVLQGVLNWRGKLLWSVDLSNLLGVRAENKIAKTTVVSSLTAVVITQDSPTRQLACIVSALTGIQEILDQQIQPLPANLPATVYDYSNGVVQLESRSLPLLLLNPSAILNSPRWRP
jgi:twitching motility protein PilI